MGKNGVPLNRLPVGKEARVIALKSSGPERRRILDFGITEGTRVESLLRSPSGNPVAYLIRGAVIALRADDASRVMVSEGENECE